MTYLCKYRHIFGKEKQGIHSYRFMNIAIIDFIFTIIISFIISYYYNINFIIIFIFFILFSIIIHYIFCVKSTLTKLFFNF
jgi:hypothetical protein